MRAAALVMAVMLCMLPACSREDHKEKPKVSKAASQYSADTIFDEVYKQAQKKPNDIEALYHLADLYDRSAQYPEAIETYKKVVKLKPDMGYVWFKMATDFDRLNKPAEAVEAFRTAAKYLPNHAVLFNNMGIAYGKLGKDEDEIAALRKAIKIRSNYAAARYNLGITYLRKKNRAAAMKEYEALKEFDEGMADALHKEIEKGT